MQKKCTLLSILICSLINLLGQNSNCSSSLTLGISFPPVSNTEQRNFTKPYLDDLQIKKIRFAEDWALREPTKGNFNWSPLDERINWAYNNQYEILLTIQSNASTWACSNIKNGQSCVYSDNNDFKNYIDTLLKRYSGKIAKIQFGNEWQSDYWYAGNASQFIASNNILYQSAKQHSPTTKVVLGGFTTFSLRALAMCNGKINTFRDDEGNYYATPNCNNSLFINTKTRIDSVLKHALYDMIDLHFYDDVENWDIYYNNFSDTITKPIIVTEFGGPNLNYELPYSDAFQAQRLEQYIKKIEDLGVNEAYFFKLVQGSDANAAHLQSGLIDENLNVKAAYNTFKNFSACTTSENEISTKNDFMLFPNPAQNQSVLTFKNPNNESFHLEIFNSEGKSVKEISNLTGNSLSIEKNDLNKGLFFVVLRSPNNEYLTKKLLFIY
ncbi:MAG: T9SS type A sorting domain-containing protein [Flavobacteriales bacterium]